MLGTRLLLFGNHASFGPALQACLEKPLGHVPPLCTVEAIRARLGPENGSALVLAAASKSDVEEVVSLVQEVRLHQWRPTVVIVESAPDLVADELAILDPYVAARFRWPAEAPALQNLVRDALGRQRRTALPTEESLEQQIERRLLSHTPSLSILAEPLALAADHDVTVLLTGETGTGKTHLARLIHECSPRRQERLLVVPCGALCANLVESELFGHAKGAFTGADRPKIGKFEAVGEGTLLLDEIDTLGLDQQANLLRVIETGEYEPVGSNQTKICRARIIAASNWDLEESVEKGRFRQDLYYRLNVMSFYLPPLRERRQDIAPLARGMVAQFARKFKKPLFEISSEAIAALEAFAWPGNLRQLENVMQQGVLMSTGPELQLQHLPKPVQDCASAPMTAASNPSSLTQNREVLERSVIQRALVNHNYNRARAASALGISRVTLYKKMKKYGLMDVPAHEAEAV